jgi:tagaturonate reductase
VFRTSGLQEPKSEIRNPKFLEMALLNRNYCTDKQIITQDVTSLPERVLQFGTGVLLRGLPDFLIDKANRQGIFNGRIVVVKSTDGGDSVAFDQQDGLYTLGIRGFENGNLIEENIVCSAISRVLSAKSQWADILKCATNPDLQIVISNTTEVGIQLVQDDIKQSPPVSFPGKLLAFLYERFKAFNGDKTKGLVIVPTELITDNGKKLEHILLELAHLNALETPFIDWLENHNTICNSLVDRIVPGKPNPTIKAQIDAELGYEDNLMTMSESYLLWAIKGGEKVKSVLSFHQVHEGVIIEPDIDLYSELKLRLLNGTHTLSCGLAFLSGFSLVKDAMKSEVLESYISRLMLSELALGIPYKMDLEVAELFGKRVLDRFRNPYLEHKWLSITMNYTSKMAMRNIPTLLHFYKKQGVVPEHFALGFAAYLLFMKAEKCENGIFYGNTEGVDYAIQDDNANYFYELWQVYSVEEVVLNVLKKQSLWGSDLTGIKGFEEKIGYFLNQMIKNGVLATLNKELQITLSI